MTEDPPPAVDLMAGGDLIFRKDLDMGIFSKYIGDGSKRSAKLDNRKAVRSFSEREENVFKIRRKFQLNGSTIWVNANTEQEYADKILRLTLKTNPNQRWLFKDFAERWFTVYAEPNIEAVTANAYKTQLRCHVLPVLGELFLDEISSDEVQKVFNRMPATAKQESKNKVKNVMNQIFRLAEEKHYIDRNPLRSSTLKIKGLASEPTEPYTIEEMRYMAANLNRIQQPTDRAWLALSISLPLRPEEVLGLRWKDLDYNVLHVRGTITHPKRNEPVYHPYTKTAVSVRDLVVPQTILNLLPERGDDNDYLVGGSRAISYTGLRWIRKRIGKDLGIEITPRRFRTTVATDISSETHDLKLVQRMLGHSTPQMTLKHYDKGRSTSVDATEAISRVYGL